MKKILSICWLCILSLVVGYGQSNEQEKALQELKHLSEQYKKATCLSFDVLYRYAMESKPAIYLDTLKGNFKLNGAQYRYTLDNTEVINTKTCSIMLFKEDKIMYLARSSASSALSNPLAILDSFFVHNRQLNCSVAALKGIKKISLVFPPGAGYKKMEYYADAKTGFITRALYWVKSDQLYDPSVRNLVDPLAGYAIVEIIFSNYREGAFDDKEFDTAKYFRLQDNEYVTVSPFETYKIFLGTPNL